MERIHALSPQLGAPARLGVEMVLSLATHQNLAIFGDLETFGE